MVADLFTRSPATSALVEAGAPAWGQRLALKLLGYFQPIFPRAPNRVWYVNKVDLPPPTDWPGAVCVVVDEACLAVSLGGLWRRINIGGPL